MAREHVQLQDPDSLPPQLQGEKRKKKKKREGLVRPKFCPNSSRSRKGDTSLNLSRSRIHYKASVTALKKNNEELAKALNSHKIIIGELKAELVAKDRRIQEVVTESATLRAGVDPQLLEAEVLRRVASAVAPIKACLDGAVDSLCQTSEYVTKGLQLASQSSRMSSMSQAGRMSLHASRQSSIGGPTFRMRSAVPGGGGEAGSPSNVSKVGPMVAGHAISRPRIQLTRQDEAAMSAARERQAADLGLLPAQGGDQQDEDDDFEEVPASPEHPGRSRFNMTNIMEGSLEDSRLDTSAVLEEEEESSPAQQPLDTLLEEPASPAQDRNLQPTVRLSPFSLPAEASLTPSGFRLSVERGVRPRGSLTPVRGVRPSPVREAATPASLTPRLSLRLPARPPAEHSQRPSLSQPSTPAIVVSLPSPSSASFPENPSESFLEALANDPGEGPSWLFQDRPRGRKKAGRSSTARQLSALFSESERESSSGACLSADSSDLSCLGSSSADTSAEASGFLLAQDLRGSSTGVFSTAPSTPTVGVQEGEQQEGSSSSDKENTEDTADSLATEELSIQVSCNTARRPLGEVAVDGGVVTFNPRTETGATVASLREAQILLKNVGTKGGAEGAHGPATPYRLSDCYVALSPGRCVSLEQLLSLGLQAGQRQGQSGSKRKLARSEGGRREAEGESMPVAKRARSTYDRGQEGAGGREAEMEVTASEVSEQGMVEEVAASEEIIDEEDGSEEVVEEGTATEEVAEENMAIEEEEAANLDLTDAIEEITEEEVAHEDIAQEAVGVEAAVSEERAELDAEMSILEVVTNDEEEAEGSRGRSTSGRKQEAEDERPRSRNTSGRRQEVAKVQGVEELEPRRNRNVSGNKQEMHKAQVEEEERPRSRNTSGRRQEQEVGRSRSARSSQVQTLSLPVEERQDEEVLPRSRNSSGRRQEVPKEQAEEGRSKRVRSQQAKVYTESPLVEKKRAGMAPNKPRPSAAGSDQAEAGPSSRTEASAAARKKPAAAKRSSTAVAEKPSSATSTSSQQPSEASAAPRKSSAVAKKNSATLAAKSRVLTGGESVGEAVIKPKKSDINMTMEAMVSPAVEEEGGRGRRARAVVSYALPKVNTKMRRDH